MFNNFEPNVKATITFLKTLKVKVNRSTVKETLMGHPDWPSLLCISDSLDKWGIPNAAGKLETKDIDILPVPFIACTVHRRSPLSVVTAMDEKSVTFYSKEYDKSAVVPMDKFLGEWTGVYLMAEPVPGSGEKEFIQNRQKSRIRTTTNFLAIAVLVGLSLLGLHIKVNTSYFPINHAVIYFQYFISLVGTFITILLLWHDIDKNNPLLQKVCTGFKKANCDAILTGKQAKIFDWLSWSEVGFFYFIGSLFSMLFARYECLSLLGWFNILALPYTVFSITYQWKIARQWCVLCLSVQVLLILGAFNIISNDLLFPFSFQTSDLINITVCYLVPVILWYALKPAIIALEQTKITKREYLRIKFNNDTFSMLLKKQKAITVPEGFCISLGNQNATNTIVKVCNPYCRPCSKAHPKIEKLLAENNNLKVQIVFSTNGTSEDPAYEPVAHILKIASENNEQLTRHALDHWYLSESKDFQAFSDKYPVKGEMNKENNQIRGMAELCKKSEIFFTPTFFLNGHQLPDTYRIEDIQYFLLE